MKQFSVSVAIGGKVLPSLAASVNATKAQVRGLEGTLAKINAGISTPLLAAQRHIDATAKRMAGLQKTGRNLAMSVTAPVAFGAAAMFRPALERDRAGNRIEAMGGASPAERKDIEQYAESIASKFGSATKVLVGFNSLLKAGLTVPAAKGSIDTVMKGAAIGDTTPDVAGDAVAKVAAQFKLPMDSVEQAGAVTKRVLDNLVYSANATVGSFDDAVQAFKFVGGAAAAAGASVEEANGLSIALIKAGQKGSEAGVALRSMFVSLVKPSKQGLATLAKLGLNLGDYVQGGRQTGDALAKGFAAQGIDITPRALDAALASSADAEKQRQAVLAAVRAHVGEGGAQDNHALVEAVNDVFAVSGNRIDLPKFVADLKKRGAAQGDIARIFQGQQSSRIASLLASDLPGIMEQLRTAMPGSVDVAFAKTSQGLEAAVNRMSAAWENFNVAIVSVAKSEVVGVLESLADSVKRLSESNPALLRTGIALTAITAAAGPMAMLAGAIGRVAAAAAGGVVASVLGLAAGVRAVGAAALLGIARLRTFAAATLVLGSVGGVRAVLVGLAAAPFTAIGAGLRIVAAGMWSIAANPVGLVITGIVVALTALGVWIANNASGIATFFSTFAGVFLEGIGGANGPLGTLVGYLKDAATWLSNLLGPIDASGEAWKSWGASVGLAAAQGVNTVVGYIKTLIGWIETLVGWAGKAGSAIASMWNAPKVLPNAPKASPIAGARALGGPVFYGKPYLVGERGPELFVPGASGNIETNNTLRRLTADGAAAVAGSSSTTTTNHGPVTLSPTFVINGADNPAAVERQIEQYMQRLMAEQRGYLSD